MRVQLGEYIYYIEKEDKKKKGFCVVYLIQSYIDIDI